MLGSESLSCLELPSEKRDTLLGCRKYKVDGESCKDCLADYYMYDKSNIYCKPNYNMISTEDYQNQYQELNLIVFDKITFGYVRDPNGEVTIDNWFVFIGIFEEKMFYASIINNPYAKYIIGGN